MSKEIQNENEIKPIKAFSFMVEVIDRPDHEKCFIVRGEGPHGLVVLTMGCYKELVQFFDSL